MTSNIRRLQSEAYSLGGQILFCALTPKGGKKREEKKVKFVKVKMCYILQIFGPKKSEFDNFDNYSINLVLKSLDTTRIRLSKKLGFSLYIFKNFD